VPCQRKGSLVWWLVILVSRCSRSPCSPNKIVTIHYLLELVPLIDRAIVEYPSLTIATIAQAIPQGTELAATQCHYPLSTATGKTDAKHFYDFLHRTIEHHHCYSGRRATPNSKLRRRPPLSFHSSSHKLFVPPASVSIRSDKDLHQGLL
jgi:hypothetical protein